MIGLINVLPDCGKASIGKQINKTILDKQIVTILFIEADCGFRNLAPLRYHLNEQFEMSICFF